MKNFIILILFIFLLFSCSQKEIKVTKIDGDSLEEQMIEAYNAGVTALDQGDILFATKINNIKPNLLFGCGGNRDKSKRKTMGLIANKFAAKVYVTDDNPRNENPFKIRQSILSKCSKAVEIPDRSIAIQKAINELNNGEILIIAGKGHEEKQIIKNKIVNFNDAKIARFYLNRRNKL